MTSGEKNVALGRLGWDCLGFLHFGASRVPGHVAITMMKYHVSLIA